jgi:hypothetical protein
LAEEESGTVMLKPSIGNEMSTGDRKGWNKLANLIFAYRLTDVIGLMNEVQYPQPRKVRRTKRIGKEKFPEVWILDINSQILNYTFPGTFKTRRLDICTVHVQESGGQRKTHNNFPWIEKHPSETDQMAFMSK